ncbi:MAG: arginine deiminase family protein [Chloroflexota bacterium]|nr:arginine deiminase family protein [Chloroflexota bacterium]
MRIAITRGVSPSIGQCELTHLSRQEIDVNRARSQHAQYEGILTDLGCKVLRLPEEPDQPDSVFVEDTAIVLGDTAVITRPGASLRRNETESIAEVLKEYRTLKQITEPGTLDGGDVLRIGRTLYVGNSARSNIPGIKQLMEIVAPYGYDVEVVKVNGCLHLKSAVSLVGEETLLINRSWVDANSFGSSREFIDIDPVEPYAANALLVGDELMVPQCFPRPRLRLESRGIGVRVVDVSELQKAEGALTCCSLIFTEERQV